ncbi:MAG: Hint domain-containing protein, partial [Paracoccaceae bacterium]
ANANTDFQQIWVSDVYFDTIPQVGGDDTIDGGIGADSIVGGIGADSLIGGADNDTIQGDDGNDTILGGDGNDSLTGGAGDDRFVLSGTFGNDTIVGGETGETSGDAIDASALTANSTLNFSGNEAGTLSDGTSTASFSQIERVTLGSGDDSVNASLTTTGVNVDAGAGNDSLVGGSGNDSLIGGTGSDTFVGGLGADTFVGGAVLDYIDYSASNAAVSIDLQNNIASGGHATGDQQTGVDGIIGSAFDDTLIGFDGFSTLPADPYTNVIYGGAGNDSIDGRAGDDSLFGGADNDTILGGDGNDSIDGGDGNDSIVGGAGSDTLLGGLGNDFFTGLTIGDIVDGSEDPGNGDIDTLDLFGSGWTKATTNIIFSSPDKENGTVQFLDNLGAVIGTLTFSNIETLIPCFTPGTVIETQRGPTLVEHIREGDRVLTRDNGYRPVVWVGRRDLTAAELQGWANMRPVVIRKGALGHDLPARDMVLSPQHRLLLTGARAELVSGETEVLAAALHLVGQEGISRGPADRPVSYIHFMFDSHEIVRSDGAWSESFQPGQTILDGMGSTQREELVSLFPELGLETGTSRFDAARMTLKSYEVKALLRG